MANDNETAEQNYAKAMAKVDELCHKVVEDPRRYAALIIDESCYWALPVSKILAIVEAAHKRELAAKDCEITRLKRENFDLNGCLLAEQELAEKRNALIKELADAASENMKDGCGHCDLRYACQEGEDGIAVPCNQVIRLREAIKKAREVVK